MQLVIVIGYGANQGVEHKSKTYDQVTDITGEAREWFIEGVNNALVAPTALNQQKFKIKYNNKIVEITAPKWPYANIDLGIVNYHFEIDSGKKFDKEGKIYE